jgi:hypothetical protein
VLERDPCSAARRQGYGVTLSETNAALGGLGILEDLRARNSRSCAHWTFHSSGRVMGYYGAAFLPRERRIPSPWTNLRVPRNEVREVLLAKLEPGTVRFGRRAVGYREHAGSIGGKGGEGGSTQGETVTAANEGGYTTCKLSGAEAGYVEVDVEMVAHDDDPSVKVGGGSGREPAGDDRDSTGGIETIRASVLVAADGVRSAVQRIRLPDKNLRYPTP